MKYFFILGNNPTLSFAEIASVFNLKPEQVLFLSADALIVDMNIDLDVQSLIRRLGGTIKLGITNYELRIKNNDDLTSDILNSIDVDKISGKFNFGISYYGPKAFKDEKKIAMELKSALKEKDVSSRWVTSREKQLSSVVVEQNKLTTAKGIEVVIIDAGKNGCYAGKTLAVQPFKELSKRDYGRPGRDDYSGMLPPKLAQIMINLVPSPLTPLPEGEGNYINKILLDPFCGSGTILAESALMGYKKLIGCDSSERAIKDTKANFEFLISTFKTIYKELISNDYLRLFQCKVENLNQKIKPNSVNVIITEPYLGPSRAKRDKDSVKKIVKELEELYYQAIKQFVKALKSNGKVVMVWPVFKGRDTVFLSAKNVLQNSDLKIINPLGNFSNNIIKLTNRQTIVYGREGQRVWREIVTLQLTNRTKKQ